MVDFNIEEHFLLHNRRHWWSGSLQREIYLNSGIFYVIRTITSVNASCTHPTVILTPLKNIQEWTSPFENIFRIEPRTSHNEINVADKTRDLSYKTMFRLECFRCEKIHIQKGTFLLLVLYLNRPNNSAAIESVDQVINILKTSTDFRFRYFSGTMKKRRYEFMREC